MAKPVLGVSVRKDSGTGGGPSGHVSATVSSGPVVDVLSELEQAVTAHRTKIHGMHRTDQ